LVEAFCVFLPWWFIPVSYPAGHDLLFFVLPKKSKQKKGAPEMATHPLNLCNRAETGKTRFAQTVPRLVSARLQKFKAPSRAGKANSRLPTLHVLLFSSQFAQYRSDFVASLSAPLVWPFPALDGALNFCCREEKGRETV
jgi:hypothetical protein